MQVTRKIVRRLAIAAAAATGLGGQWLGSGKTSKGIAVGATQTFVFHVAGADAAALTASDFLTEAGNLSVVASYKGFKHGKKDRVAGAIVTSPTPAPLVP